MPAEPHPDNDNIKSASTTNLQDAPSSSITKVPSVQETETTPLLAIPPAPVSASLKHTLSPRTLLILIALPLLLVQSGDQLIDTPQTRIFESIFCYKYYEIHDPSKILIPRGVVGPGALGGVEEHWCKISEVQAQVANLKGVQAFLNGFPSLLLAIPVGILADRWGRKWLLLVGLLSFPLKTMWTQLVCWFWQSLDLRLTWLSALHGLLGGSDPVVAALIYTVVSDVADENNRAIVFTRIFSAVMLGNFLFPPLSAWMMIYSPWIPLFLGIALELGSVLIFLPVPETLGYKDATSNSKAKATSPSHSPSSFPPTSPETSSPAKHYCTPLFDALDYFLQDWRITCLLSTFLIQIFTISANPLLLLYSSTRYNLTFSLATTFLSIRSGFTIALFLAIQPYLSHLLTNSGFSSKNLDFTFAKASAAALALGYIAMGFATNMVAFVGALVIVTLGAGYAQFVRSYLTGLVDRGKVAELYTLISIVDTVGMMVGSPLFAWLFEMGLGVGGLGMGLPWWCLGGLCAGMYGMLCRVGHEEGDDVVVVVVEEEGDE